MKHFVWGLSAVVLGLFVASGSIAAPTQQKVTESVNISAPPDKVWGIIQNFGDVTWATAIKS